MTLSIPVLQEFSGLTVAEAASLLARDGPNALPNQKPRGVWNIAFEVAREPMFLMLVGAGLLYLAMGSPGDALMLLGFVFVVMGITIVQERRTERALDALKDLSSPKARVVRNGVHQLIPGTELVCGDIILLSEGDRVPADALLQRCQNLFADEFLLTGESVPVQKIASEGTTKIDRPGGNNLPTVFSGTLITAGEGIAQVVATGLGSELGKIGQALQQIVPEKTLLQKETGRLVRAFALFGLGACIVVVVTYSLTRGGGIQVWKEGLLAGITMAMAILPEEFPVILTIFLALGASRIARSNVLTRRMPAVETLGAATVLCVDKTGTLTQNQMTLRSITPVNNEGVPGNCVELSDHKTNLSEIEHQLLEFSILASKRDPFDPMEKALHTAGKGVLDEAKDLHPQWSVEREYPLSPKLLAVSYVWKTDSPQSFVVATKGAPEAIAELCHFNPEQKSALLKAVAEQAARGLRILGVASGSYSNPELPEKQSELLLKFVGLLGFEDPLRPKVQDAVAECQSAGIRVVMITGDYPETAQSIARQAGLKNTEFVITGSELETMSPEDLAVRIKNVHVFARVVPEQKLRIVNALKANREIVAMTGDGVNDAPALKAAHIGIAMGGRGTDVARESASLVLLDDNFASIVAAIRLGRRIFDNIKKAIAFTLAVHLPIVGLSMLPVFFANWPLLLLPVHIVFLELIIDPTCSLIFEAEEAEGNIMLRPPRNSNERLFSFETVIIAVLQGLSSLAVCLGVFLYYRSDHSIDVARLLTFASLVASFLSITLVNRSWSKSLAATLFVRNRALGWVLAGASIGLATILFVPAVQKFFHFESPNFSDLAICLAAGFSSVLWFELLKVVRKHSVAARNAQIQESFA